MLSTLKAKQTTDLKGIQILAELPLPAWIADTNDFSIRFANRAASALYGFSAEEFINLNFLDLFTEESRIGFFHAAAEAANTEGINSVYGHIKKDASRITVALHLSSLLHDGHVCYQVTAMDISRSSAHAAMEEETARYKTFIQQSAIGIFCQEFKTPYPINASLDEIIEHSKKNSYISECNDAMARMYGFEKAEELKGILSEQIIDYSDAANIQFLQAFINNGFRIVNAESHEKDRYGNAKYFLNNIIGIVENGLIKRVWGTQQDITDQKKTEEKLQLLANLVEQTSDVLTAADTDFKPTTWNKAAERIYGVTAAQVVGKNLRDFITIHYLNTDRETVREIIRQQGEWRGETCFVRPTDKKLITLWMSFKLMKDDKENPLGYLVSATDITERKEAEWRIRESENRFRDMADSSPVMIWICDEKNTTTYINKKWQEFTGKNIIGDPDGWSELVHRDDIEKAKSKYFKAFKSRKEVTIIYRLRYRDGSYRWVQDVSVPRFSNGTFIGYIGSLVDIEGQKQKEQQLLYQATILENVSDIVVTTDLDYRVRAWNKIAETYYGLSETEAIGRRMGELVRFSYYGTTVEQAFADLQQNGIWQGEVSNVNTQGDTSYFWQTVKFIYDSNHNKIGFLAVGRDITDWKLADEKMKKSEEFYRTLIADSLDGMILMDQEGKITFSSPSVKNVLGYEVNELMGRNAFEFVHPQDFVWASESFLKEVTENPDVKFIVVRLLKKDGNWLWCMVRGHNLLKNSNVNGIVIYFHDDTLRKQATEALKKSEKRFKDLIRDLQIGVVLQDKEGKTILCNDAFAQIFAMGIEELAGKSILDIAIDPVHEDGRKYLPEERPTYKAIYTRQPAKDVVMGIYRPKQKDRVWIMINIDPILDKEGEVDHLISSVKDITDRKKMEAEKIAKQISHQRQLTQATLDGQEAERTEIGKELHDNIGQQLTTVKLFLDLARSSADDSTGEMVNMALKGVSDIINEVRAMSRSLIPSTLQDLGLIDSITELADSITRTQLMEIIPDYFDFDEDVLAENQKLSLFRIIQEQLNNIVKHAGAKQVFIKLSSTDSEILLEIKDDGKGFDPKNLKKGLGFINIRNRAELFGGKKEVISRPGEGCLLKVSFPHQTSLQQFFPLA